MCHYIYFMESQKTFQVYVGRTDKDPKTRINEHNNGQSTWSSSRRPFKLIYFEKYLCKADAIQRELFYKSGFGKLIKKSIMHVLIHSGRSSDG